MAQATCRAGWCISLPVEGSIYCVTHKQYPPLHNLESEKDWGIRVRRLKASQKRAADRRAIREQQATAHGKGDARD